MKVCPNCQNSNIADEAAFCPVCGMNFKAPYQQNPQQTQGYGSDTKKAFNQQGYQAPPQQAPQQPVKDQYDHTDEFDAADIADNKLYAMLIYLFGPIGIIFALIKKDDSAYLKFHLKQGLKLLVCYGVIVIAMAVLSWTCIAPALAGIALIALYVVQIICFFDVCKNKAKDAYIIRGFKFLD